MQIQITIGDQRFAATLDDSAAAATWSRSSPSPSTWSTTAGWRRPARCPRRCPWTASPRARTPTSGDLGYYAPGNDLVLYYGDQSYFPGIVVLGPAATATPPSGSPTLDGAVTATVEAR